MDQTIVLSFADRTVGIFLDIEVPADMTASELLTVLNQSFHLGIQQDDIQNCYLKAENPIALLRGSCTLREYGLRNGSVIRCRG